MKKWLITLSILFGISLVGTAALAGQVYYQELKVYTDHDKKDLNKESLENIYITSSIPIEIYPTSGEPYVEFNQKFTDLIGAAPEYELEVNQKGSNTYIDLKQIKEHFLWVGVKDMDAQLSVYLPQATIKRLNIEDEGYYGHWQSGSQMINLEGIDVKELNVTTNRSEFMLDGNYEKINIRSTGRITLNSQSPAEVYISGRMNQYLTGSFSKIISDATADIVIESDSNAQVEIINGYQSRIDLKGSYSKVKVDANYSEIDIRSEGLCEISTNGYENSLILNGAFNKMIFSEDHSRLEVKTTAIPQLVNLGTYFTNNEINLTLPSNIPGMTVRYLPNDYSYYDDNLNEYEFKTPSMRGLLLSDFEISEKIGSSREVTYVNGDGSLTLILSLDEYNMLQLIDGGYNSVA